eukprot:4720980-Amphidinium_carterae.1
MVKLLTRIVRGLARKNRGGRHLPIDLWFFVVQHQTRYLENVVSAFPELFKVFEGGRDSLFDPESFKGQPTDVTCDRRVLKHLLRLHKVGGFLLRLVTRSRPDIAYSHSRIASLQTKDTKTSWEMLKAVSSYLFPHIELGVKVKPESDQLVIATLALPLAVLGVTLGFWFNGAAPPLLGTVVSVDHSDTRMRMSPPSASRLVALRCDNQAAIAQVLQPPLRTEAVNQGNASLGWVRTKDQKSDCLTKLVPRKFQLAFACFDALGLGWVYE